MSDRSATAGESPVTDRLSCPSCGEATAATDVFCESCGSPLKPQSPPPQRQSAGVATNPSVCPCVACGGEVGSDGWCTVCGVKASNGREHVVEQPAPRVAGVSDKGIVHPRNEDAAALAADPDTGWAALVVCDGVTTATDSDVASLAAVNAAIALLNAAPRPPNTSAEARIAHWSERLIAAAAAANRAATEAAHAIGDVENPPSATFVAAVAERDVLVAAWIGDSRAYWLPEAGPAEQLSVDDSWATAQINIGVSRDVAEASPQAHAITRWIGSDGPSGDASTSATTARSPGWLMLCSDGLWNYCSEASELAKLVYSLTDSSAARDPLPLAESLVTWANEQGGHDNITVTLAYIEPAAEVEPAAETDPTASEVEMKESF
ncbi:MAG: hypothetical protein JWN47_2855 [Frankiales bacterium]|nr:hypothetical protein [Frankiales bacterium]